jgi:hypothetical protein
MLNPEQSDRADQILVELARLLRELAAIERSAPTADVLRLVDRKGVRSGRRPQ